MTCNNCEHYEVCDNHTMNLCNSCYWNVDVVKPKYGTCGFFKDKSKIIELPCKVGDTVYSYCECFGAILPYFIETLTIGYFDEKENYYTFEANCTENLELLDCIDFDVDDIDKTVFLTQEKAEAALKQKEERNGG